MSNLVDKLLRLVPPSRATRGLVSAVEKSQGGVQVIMEF